MKPYKVYAALTEDVNQGWVWLRDDAVTSRCIVKLSTNKFKKTVYCEARKIDDNFKNSYNAKEHRNAIDSNTNILVAAEWYREKLGIRTKETVEINVKPVDCFWGKYKACKDHPQIIVRYAVALSFIGVILGLLGVILGLAGLICGSQDSGLAKLTGVLMVLVVTGVIMGWVLTELDA